MGTLSEELAVSMLRNFQLAQVTVQAQWEADLAQRANKPPVWRWTPGTFVFPEGLCCYCGGVMASAAIWRTDNLQFLGSWKLASDGGGVGHFKYDDSHPHVNDGSICMGGNNRASSVGDALFLAFNPLSMYFRGGEDELKAWFADRFDHVCGQGEAVTTAAGIDLRHVVAPEDGCFCQPCRVHRGDVACPRCQQWYTPGIGHGTFKCDVCNSSGRISFCFQHQHDRHQCVDCTDRYDNWDVATGELLAEPYIKQCPECGEWVCRHCLGEAEGCEREHSCGEDSDEDTEQECDHHCRDCCRGNDCEWYAENSCGECSELYDNCTCDSDDDDDE